MPLVNVIQADELQEGKMKAIATMGEYILLVNYKGNYYATDARCTHAGGDLSKGKLKGKHINCPLHGSKFDITTGNCKAGPRINIIRSKVTDKLKTYEVMVEDNTVSVRL